MATGKSRSAQTLANGKNSVEFRPGWREGPTVSIPHNTLPRHFPLPKNPPKDVNWLVEPRPRHVAQISLFFASPRATASLWSPATAGASPLRILRLRDGTQLHIVRIDHELAPKDFDELESFLRGMRLNTAGDPAGMLAGSMMRIYTDQVGRPALQEIQLGPDNVHATDTRDDGV
jgi:hypothetical protein